MDRRYGGRGVCVTMGFYQDNKWCSGQAGSVNLPPWVVVMAASKLSVP